MGVVQIPRPISDELKLCTKPTRVQMGSKHVKVFVGNRMIGVVPRDFRKREGGGDGSYTNVIRAIRKADRE